ncbi:MAG: hypothetical protein DRO87_12640 [Candidatus Thorarchaeota archaeon]|nr:MAG: hypothetical protein DRO87_12640 [Candidatus Thorarchaeota archaeon]
MRQPGETRGAPVQPRGMRNLIRCAMLAIMAEGRYPNNDDVRKHVTYDGEYNPCSFKVQCSQVRNDLLMQLKIDVPQKKVQGSNTSNDAKAAIERQLRRKRKRVERLAAA